MLLINIIKQLYGILQKNNVIYQILAVVSPFSIAYLISPENFPENKIYSLFIVVFHTLIFMFIYRVYFDQKMKVNENIRNRTVPNLIKNKYKIENLQKKLNEKEGSYNKHIFLKYIINKSSSDKIKNLLISLENAENKIKNTENWNEEINYKHFDYTLMFSGSYIYVLKIFFIVKNETFMTN